MEMAGAEVGLVYPALIQVDVVRPYAFPRVPKPHRGKPCASEEIVKTQHVDSLLLRRGEAVTPAGYVSRRGLRVPALVQRPGASASGSSTQRRGAAERTLRGIWGMTGGWAPAGAG